MTNKQTSELTPEVAAQLILGNATTHFIKPVVMDEMHRFVNITPAPREWHEGRARET